MTVALAVAVMALGLSTAPAQTTGDTVTVTDEPAGDNCEFGGVKITVTHAEPTPEPTEDPTEEPTPEPTATEDPTEDPTETPMARAAQAEPDVTYVCNGQAGPPGDNGENGSDGADGDNGDNGADGLDGMDADPDTPGVQATRSNRCATAKTIRVRVPARFRNGQRVRVTANGRRRTSRVRKHKVAANLKTVPCGYWPVLISKRGKRSALVVLHLTNRRVSRASV